MRSPRANIRLRHLVRLAFVAVVLAGSGAVSAQQAAETDEPATAQAVSSADEAPVAADEAALEAIEANLANYLHFALIGQFEVADSYAQALLDLPVLDPLSPQAARELVRLTGEDYYKDAIDVLLLLINNTPIADNAREVLDLIRQAHRTIHRDPRRILDSIALLAGTPTQRMTGLERLRDTGEYAVPWLLRVLDDPDRAKLHPFVIDVFARLGQEIVNPMVQALGISDPVIQRAVAQGLGELGYPQALPYLKRLASDPQANPLVRSVATEAIATIIAQNPGALDLPAFELFADLAEGYYDNADALAADPRDETANVWYATGDTVKPIAVPRAIFHLVMSMRCCEQALELEPDAPEVVALWLAANFRREAALGLDVQNDQVVETEDRTRPPDFLRNVYFARVAGPRLCLRVLGRGLVERDRHVALGAIAAMDGTAGPAVMAGAVEDSRLSLGQALVFPDLLVRVKAALALGRAMPTQPFEAADVVVPVLASTLTLTGQRYYLLVEPDETVGRRLTEELTKQHEADVHVAARFTDAMTWARRERTHLDGIFLNASIANPPLVQAMRALAEDEHFGLVPVVVYARHDEPVAEGSLDAVPAPAWRLLRLAEGQEVDAKALLVLREEAAGEMGVTALDEEVSGSLALEAARVLRDLAIHGRSVLDPAAACSALIEVLDSPSEQLRIESLQVLGLLDRADAQRAIAAVALSDEQSDRLRKVAYVALAESARQFGSHLDAAMTLRLHEEAFAAEDLEIRTYASRAVGALNLAVPKTANVILTHQTTAPAP